MNINAVADSILTYLSTKHDRVYRNKAPQTPTFPYVVYRVDSVTNTYPSDDLYLNIDIYDVDNASVRAIETLADTIDTGLNRTIISTTDFNAQIEREARQFIPSQELIGVQMVNIRYTVRTYFK